MNQLAASATSCPQLITFCSFGKTLCLELSIVNSHKIILFNLARTKVQAYHWEQLDSLKRHKMIP